MNFSFNKAARVAKYITSKFSLKKAFGIGAVTAVTAAPQKTGEFIGSRATGLFNGLARGVGRGMLENPVVLATGLAALAVVGSAVWSRLSR
ncbi:hypothetical protein [Shimia sediminis]|uniref:hypothetical protein n=1 Tax=Shimia sediminis TaxID=2497945 RepID=UPI000F8F349C|nr:hypothetical protein [Shimia sediminis]